MKVCLDWVKDYVNVKDKPPMLAERLTMRGLEAHISVDDRGSGLAVFDTEVTSNRPDWLSHVGVAREIAAVSGGKLNLPGSKFPKGKMPWELSGETIRVRIEDKKRCPYYSCVVLEGVKDEPSPKFMHDRLTTCGLRPVSLVVDVTNYVLLELGQPLHAFDLDLLTEREIIVRTARPGEKIRAIDRKEYALAKEDLVIADHNHPVAIAGVMGGMESEFGHKTKRVLLESAYFQPRTVRVTSKRLALMSESSYRFERGVDPLLVDAARDRAVYLIAKYGSLEKISHVHKAGRVAFEKRKITLHLPDMDRILGLKIPPPAVRKIFFRLGLGVRPKTKSVIEVTVPSFRPDLTRPIDLVEEAARIYGYDRIPETIPTGLLPGASEVKILEIEEAAAQFLAGAGYFEAVSFSLENDDVLRRLSFLAADATTIVNPQNRELTVMRPSLAPGLLRAFALNADHGAESIRLFEIARVFGPESEGKLPAEEAHAAFILSGKKDSGWGGSNRKAGFFDLKGLVESFLETLNIQTYDFRPYSHKLFAEGEALEVFVGGEAVGYFGALGREPQAVFGYKEGGCFAEINLTRLVPHCSKIVKYVQPCRFPSAKRDIALIVGEDVSSSSIAECIKRMGREWVRKVEVFDVFQGGSIPEGKRSLAFSVEYGSEERTLTSEEVNDLHRKIGTELTNNFNAQIR
ncbi:MAG: phenylalanine--tRNA ligase subunit beta [Candidatus Omnitrophica bacterium]|nr:phenylalanine--tRNA ligase subunit beta [Candidatus Omnitrophota bacterium]